MASVDEEESMEKLIAEINEFEETPSRKTDEISQPSVSASTSKSELTEKSIDDKKPVVLLTRVSPKIIASFSKGMKDENEEPISDADCSDTEMSDILSAFSSGQENVAPT